MLHHEFPHIFLFLYIFYKFFSYFFFFHISGEHCQAVRFIRYISHLYVILLKIIFHFIFTYMKEFYDQKNYTSYFTRKLENMLFPIINIQPCAVENLFPFLRFHSPTFFKHVMINMDITIYIFSFFYLVLCCSRKIKTFGKKKLC